MIDGHRPGSGTATPPRLSIILATINERENLPALFDRIRALPLPPFELLVIDDGSTDGTREFVTSQAAIDPRVRPLFHDGRQTTLRAQCQGIAAARGSEFIVMDADLQHPPESIPAMVAELERGRSLVVASRYAPGGSPGPRPIGRRLISRTAEFLARRGLPEARRVTDPVSGYFGFRREVYRPLDPGYRGYKLLLFLLVMNGPRAVGEVGYSFEPRAGGTSKLTQGVGFIRIFLSELRRARAYRRAAGPGASPVVS